MVKSNVVTVVGWHNAGKTLFVELLIAELKRRGLRVAVIKHTRSHYDVDHEGTDTWRFARAGGDVVGIVGPHGLVLMERSAEELSVAQVLDRLPADLDLIILEGYKSLPLPKIVIRGEATEPAITGPGVILWELTARPDGSGGPAFPSQEISAVADAVLAFRAPDADDAAG